MEESPPGGIADAMAPTPATRRSPVVQLVDGLFDRVVRPTARADRELRNPYLLCQYIGFAMGALVVLAVTEVKGLAFPVAAGLILLSILIVVLLYKSEDMLAVQHPFLGWARKGVYHYQIAILAAATLALRLFDEPIFPFLDVLVIGVAVAQLHGRIGCLMVGCCHGRPAPWGVRYEERHFEAGYRHYLPGVRLFPVQLLEAVWLFGLAIIAATILIGPSYEPGDVLAWYVLAYGAGRFVFEFLRADTARLYFAGFTEAQWTALLLTSAVAGAELAGILPARAWHVGAAAALVAVTIAVGLRRRVAGSSRHLLLHPYHLREVAGVVNWLLELADDRRNATDGEVRPGAVYSADTTLGLQVSVSVDRGQPRSTYEYSLSWDEQPKPSGATEALARFIVRCRHAADSYEMTASEGGALSIRISPAVTAPSGRAPA
jgi:Prolipoprotein diacylglyceryl transferase